MPHREAPASPSVPYRDQPVALDRPTVEMALRMAPERCPDPKDSDREIWMKAGARQLALRLLRILENQEEAP